MSRLGELAQALVLFVIAALAMPIAKSTGLVQPLWIVIVFALIFATVFVSPLVSGLLDAKYGVKREIRKGIYVEFYVRDRKAHISVFRNYFNLSKNRLEVEGHVFEIKTDNGAYDVCTSRPKSWRSRFLNIDKGPTGRRHLQYFYTSDDDAEITGSTRMQVDRTLSFADGFFADIRNHVISSRVIPFRYARLAMNESRRMQANKDLFNSLKRDIRRCLKTGGGSFFQDSLAPALARMVAQDDERLPLIFSDEALAQVRLWRADMLRLFAEPAARESEEEAGIFKLISAALARSGVHAKYSKVRVGSAVVDETGLPYVGINVENAAYPLGTCAEQSAIASFVSETGGDRRLVKVCLTVEGLDDILPCGGCLQRIAQFAAPHCEIVVSKQGRILHRRTLEELLPHRFQFDG